MAEHTAHESPGIPQIRDEAADTPMWVPVLGLALMVLVALVFAFEVANAPEPSDEAAPAEEAAPAAPAEAAPARPQ